MATTYSTNLQLIKIGTGEQAGTWGDTTNYNIGTLVEQAISGYATVSFAAGDVTLTMDPGLSCTARNIYLELTGATAARTLTVPGTAPNANNKLYFVYNNSGYAITVKVASQTGVTLPNGAKSVLVCNGTDVVPAVNYISGTTSGLSVDSTGRALVGTTTSPSSPNAKIVVSGTTDSGIQLASTSGGGSIILAPNGAGTAVYTYTGAVGSETYTERMRIDSNGNIYGTSGTTSMTNGFIYVPSASGKPTGAATGISGRTPLYYDQSENQLYAYNSSSSSWNIPTPSTMKNHIINGNMVVCQRGTSFSGVTNTTAYPVDRFGVGTNGVQVLTVSQDNYNAPTNIQTVHNAKIEVTTANTSFAAGNYIIFTQPIEGYNVRDLIGQPFTLSFWVKSSVTGTYCVSFRNQGTPVGTSTRSYVAEYTINVANTWEYKTITATLTTAAASAPNWNWDYQIGLYVDFCLGAGTLYQTTKDAWQNGNFLATSNQVNFAGTVGNVCAFTGVQLEKGSTATAYEYRSIGLESMLCLRYYWRLTGQNYASAGVGSAAASNYAEIFVQYPVVMRTVPTVAQSNTALTDGNTAVSVTGFASGGQVYNQTGLFYPNVASGLTQFRPYKWVLNNNPAGYIEFNAEL